MGKQATVTEADLIQEDERLERLFRHTITKRKHLKLNAKQFQSRALDLLDSIFKAGIANKALLPLILKRTPNVLNNFCISAKGAEINGQRIMQSLLQVVNENMAELPRHPDAVDNLVKTIFNIFVYKKPKDYVQDLLRVILSLLKAQNSKIERIIEQNLSILISFLDKGKEIEKVFFTFRKILSHSHFCLYSRFEELLGILESTRNNLFVEQFLKFLFETFHSKLLTAKEESHTAADASKADAKKPTKTTAGGETKVVLSSFYKLFDAHCMQIYSRIVEREQKSGSDESKKAVKSRLYLERLIEYLKGNTQGMTAVNMSKTLALLKMDRKGKE